MNPTPGSESRFAVTVRRPVAILMVTVAAVVFGAFSYRLLPVELMPDVSYPSLTVRTEYEGAAPQEVEENVTRPLEEALGVVGGLVRMSSVSRAGLSDVTLEFTWDTVMSQAWQEVTERLDSVFLPDEADVPLILRYDPSLEPVIRLTLSSSLDEELDPAGMKRLRTFAEQELKRRMEQIAGVAAVRVLGGLEEQISVALNEAELRRTGLSIEEVGRRLAAENVNIAGGDIKEGDTQYLVRTVNEFRSLGEISALVVARVDGRNVRLGDIGAVTSGWADRKVITRLHRREAVELEIQKEADANVVTMAANVRDSLDGPHGMRSILPRDWSLELVSDRSRFIRASVSEVRNTAVIGGLLAVLVLFLFLRNFSATAVVSVAIPVSVAATFAPMNLSGLSLNVMSLGGLALGIGMLVDSGIVVIESISRCRNEGDDTRTAVVRGTSEVGTAVIASTLTTVAVFFPMVFVEGVAGQVFADLALTVVYALLASLLVSVFLVPSLAARLHRGEDTGPDPLGWRWRLGATLKYRSLGPLSEEPAPGGFAGLVTRVLPIWPLLAVAGLLAAWKITGPDRGFVPFVAAVPALALAVTVLATNLVLRIRGGRTVGAVAGALAMLVMDPLLLVLESAWLLLLWVIGAIAGLAAIAVIAAGRVLRVLLWPLTKLFDVTFSMVEAWYPRLIRGALKFRTPVLVIAAAGLIATAVGFSKLDSSLIPEVHQNEFDLEISLPVGTPLHRTLEAVAPLESRAVEDDRIDRVLLKVGADPGADSEPEEGEHTARLSVTLADEAAPAGLVRRATRSFSRAARAIARAGSGGLAGEQEERVVADLREVLNGLPDLQAQVTRPVLFSFRSPIEVEVEAYDLGELRLLADRARREMERIPYLTDVKSTARPGSPEVQIAYDRDALIRLGLDLRDVATLVRTKVQGSSTTEYRKRERRIDIVVRLNLADRSTVRQLRNLVVNPGAAVPVPLSAVAEVTIAAGPADIRRVGQRRMALIQANLAGGGLGRASDAIEDRMDSLEWPAGTGWRLAGQVQEMQRSIGSLWQALALSVFLVYVVMASQFESMLHPLLIMITVPLALLGVVAVLWALQIPLSVVVFLGMIMLAGIVVNNAIVFVDYVNTLRRRGQPVDEALVEAGRVRLRPILMTTATTVLGLLPMALGLGDGAEIRTPMAITVIAGLISSTTLTLVVLPTAYSALESVRSGLRSGNTTAPSSGAPAADRA